MIIHLQNLANQLPDAFTDPKRVTKSHIPAANAPIKIDVPVGQSTIENKPETRMKRGRPIGSKDKNPRKRKGAMNQDGQNEDVTLEESQDIIKVTVPEETQVPESCENDEISINYVINGEKWNRNKVNVDDIFAHNTALDVMNDNEDHDPKSVKECKQRDDWPKWKDAIEAELKSLEKRKVFEPVVHTHKGINPVEYKWIFV